MNRISGLEIQLAEEKNEKKIIEYQSKQTINQLSAENEVQKSEITRISREKDILHEKIRDIEEKIENEKKTLVLHKKESSTIIQNLEKNLRDSKIIMNDLEAKILHFKSVELENQFTTQNLNNSIEMMKIEHIAIVDGLKKEAQYSSSELERLYVEKLEKIKENTREALSKVNKHI